MRPLLSARIAPRAWQAYRASGLPRMFAYRAAVEDRPPELLIYDVIGYGGVSAKDFVLALARCGQNPVNIRISSPGGDPFEGLAIYNAIKGYPAPVNIYIDSNAASAASFIAMAGAKIIMAEQSSIMIHNSSGLCFGQARDMRDTAGILDMLDGQMAEIYAAKAGRPVADMAAAMAAETWYVASAAKDAGLCDEIVNVSQKAFAHAEPIITASRRVSQRLKAEMQPYDPDGDGDNDAQEALTLVQAAMGILDQACDALTGEDETDTADAAATTMPMVPGAELTLTSEVKFSPEEVINAFEHDRDSVQEIEAPETLDPTEMAAKLRFARARQRQAEAEILL